MLSCANLLKFQLLPASKSIPIYHATFSTWCRGVVVWSSSLWGHNFIGPQVRIQVQTENVSVIFFCADFSTSSYLKLANHIFGGVHKKYGPKRERGRLFYPMYLMTWFIVDCWHEVCIIRMENSSWFPATISGGPNRTGLTGFTGPVRYPVRFGPVRYFPQIPNRTFLMKCVPKWYLRLDFTFKSSKVAIFLAKFQRFLFKVT